MSVFPYVTVVISAILIVILVLFLVYYEKQRASQRRPHYPYSPRMSQRGRLIRLAIFIIIVVNLVIIFPAYIQYIEEICCGVLGPNPTPTTIIISGEPSPTPTPVGLPTPTPVLIINLPPSSVDIVVDAPSSMLIKHSYVVKVSLVPKGQPLVSSMPLEKATATASDTIAVGTPSTPLNDAFGPGYEPRATATLSPNAGPFQIIPSPETVKEQSLRQPKIVWKWDIIPLEMGPQILDVEIDCVWRSAKGDDQGPYTIGDRQFRVEVNTPTPTPTPIPPTPTPVPPITIAPVQININNIASTLLPYIIGTVGTVGTGGLVALFIDWLKKRKKKRKGGKPANPRPKKKPSNGQDKKEEKDQKQPAVDPPSTPQPAKE